MGARPPKPRPFSKRVCTYCNTSPIDKKCPNCGAPNAGYRPTPPPPPPPRIKK